MPLYRFISFLGFVLGIGFPFHLGRADEFAGKTVRDYPMAMELIAARHAHAPKAGEKAADFDLEPMSGGKLVALSSFWKERPLALFFGSASCDASARAAGEIRKLYEAYGSKVQFLYVYIREAHPENGWEHGKGSEIIDPVTILERQMIAQKMCTQRHFPFPALIDRLSDDAAAAYAAWPARCFLIDKSGIIQYAGYSGPWGFKPTEATKLIEILRPDLLKFAPKQSEVVSLEAFLKNYFGEKSSSSD